MKPKDSLPATTTFAIGIGLDGCVFGFENERALDDDAAAVLKAQVILTEAIITAEKEQGVRP